MGRKHLARDTSAATFGQEPRRAGVPRRRLRFAVLGRAVVPPMRGDDGRLTGKVAIVTGASKGLGVAIAKSLAHTGATAAVNCATGGKERNESYHLVTAGALHVSRSEG